ncbi:sigma-70 family RNA polymerase sigma factor [Alteromonadaceae bacterium BrNp21-10]|nr:sigma-70 family RNA polymerase sigma factor [Alteromonadaceae bacterium BrNp21-10]
MSLSIAIRSWFSLPEDNDWLMEKYVISQRPEYLEKLYDNCADDLFHFLLSQSDYHLAQDISQKTWLRVIDKRHLFHSQQYFKSWLFTIARNLLIDDLRHSKRLIACDDVDIEVTVSTPDNQTLKTTFDQALLMLPFNQREAFILQQEGFSINDIAHITNTEAETIKSRLRHAKRQLRTQLEHLHE